jgi:hypothetical protein
MKINPIGFPIIKWALSEENNYKNTIKTRRKVQKNRARQSSNQRGPSKGIRLFDNKNRVLILLKILIYWRILQVFATCLCGCGMSGQGVSDR